MKSLHTLASFLCIAAAGSAQIDVGLCAAAGTIGACQWTDVQTRLQNSGMFNSVTIVNAAAATPTLAQLQAFDALLVWTNTTPVSNVALGDVLADYVDGGGGVVVAVFANSTTTAGRNIGGRWQNVYEVIMDQSGNASGVASLGTVLVPGHPVMAGVAAFQGGTTSSRPNGTALAPGSTMIAQWSDGKVLVAEGQNPRRIDLGFYPPNASCVQAGWVTGGDQLMVNALLHVATVGNWAPYGDGCGGTMGVPTLQAPAGVRPVPGSTFTLTLGNLPFSVGLVSMGFSNTTSGPFTLPLDLSQFGLSVGCFLRAEVVVTQLLIGAGNSATWSLGLPNSSSYLGVSFYNQGFAIDPPANNAGVTVSNAGRGSIGV
jgi:hypothetical protein